MAEVSIGKDNPANTSGRSCREAKRGRCGAHARKHTHHAHQRMAGTGLCSEQVGDAIELRTGLLIQRATYFGPLKRGHCGAGLQRIRVNGLLKLLRDRWWLGGRLLATNERAERLLRSRSLWAKCWARRIADCCGRCN